MFYLLAVVEDHSAVWPTVMIHETQIWEKPDSDCLKAPLVAHSETITVNLRERGDIFMFRQSFDSLDLT